MSTRHLTASAVLAATLVLSACGSDDAATTTGSATPGAGAGTSAETAEDNATKGNDADVSFLVGMKPHHEQAVEMSEMVLAADPPADVAAIAEQIKAAQVPEIEQITTMLTDLGQPADGAAHGGGHSAGMADHGGMMNDGDMAALMSATGADAARLYLEGMIRHHEGAIEASDAELADGTYEPALELAQEIKQAQASEITAMQALLTSL